MAQINFFFFLYTYMPSWVQVLKFQYVKASSNADALNSLPGSIQDAQHMEL